MNGMRTIGGRQYALNAVHYLKDQKLRQQQAMHRTSSKESCANPGLPRPLAVRQPMAG